MKRLVLVLLTAGAFTPAFGGAGRAADQAGWSSLAVWKGHDPGDRLGVGRTSFLDDPRVARNIKAVLPTREWELLRRFYTLGDDFSVLDHYLIGDVCRPHDCGAENGTMVFDLKGNDLWVALFSHVGRSVSTRWFGTADYVDLPPLVLAAVLSVHRPAP